MPGVLLIEADILVRTPLAAYLRECGFRVLEASSAADARALLASPGTGINTVLLDADLPGESGFAFAAWARAQYRGIEVILTGNVERATAKAGELCEEGPALRKPYDHRLVLQEIRRRLAARAQNAGED